MSVHQLKDGRWIVQHAKGKDPERPTANKKYFGRGRGAEMLAIRHDEQLHGKIKGSAAYKEKAIQAVEKKITDLSKSIEKDVRDELAFLLRLSKKNDDIVVTERFTESGVIDILTDDEIIEIKYHPNWKSGIGQLIAYRQHYPDKKLRLHLFDKPHLKTEKTLSEKKVASICKTAREVGISISFHSRNQYLQFKEFHKEIVPLF